QYPLRVMIDQSFERAVIAGEPYRKNKRFKINFSKANYSFKVRMNDGTLSLWINHQPVIQNYSLSNYDPHGGSRPGFGENWRVGHNVFVFSDLKLRRLSHPLEKTPSLHANSIKLT